MTSPEDASYAIASWQRFENALPSDLLRAITSAFALVATADGDLAEDEVAQYATMLAQQSSPLAELSPEQVRHAFAEATTALLSDPHASRERAFQAIAGVRDNATECQTVLDVAEVAMNADHKVRGSEQEMLRDIQAALGVSGDS